MRTIVRYDITVKCKFCGSITTAENLTERQIRTLQRKTLIFPDDKCQGDPRSLSQPHMEMVHIWDEHYEIIKREVQTATRSDDN